MKASEVIERLKELMEVAGCDPHVTIEGPRPLHLETAIAELQPCSPCPEFGDIGVFRIKEKDNTEQVIRFV